MSNYSDIITVRKVATGYEPVRLRWSQANGEFVPYDLTFDTFATETEAEEAAEYWACEMHVRFEVRP